MNKIWLMAVGVGIALALGVGGLAAGLTAQRPATSPGGSNNTTTAPITVTVPNQQMGISVTGEGKVSVTPDVAILQLGVQAQSSSVADAQSQASQAMNKVMNALTTNGIAQDDIQTQQFSITQLTRYDQNTQTQVVTGYQVTNTVSAKIRDISKTGEIIDAAATAGGDLTRVNSVTFTLNDPTAATTQARDLAMTNAKSKAQQLAEGAGVTLGTPTYISESSYVPVAPVPMAAESKAAVSTPISPGQQEITVTVQVTYGIIN